MCKHCNGNEQSEKIKGVEEMKEAEKEMPTHKYKDYTNRVFGRLTVLGLDHIQQKYKPDGRPNGHRYYYKCRCSCGNIRIVLIDHLVSGKIRSCNCLQKERASLACTKHGLRNSRIYRIWGGMIQRCINPNIERYDLYGGRGITVCEEWMEDFLNFYNWSMNNGYQDNLTIDRIDVNGNYDPDNCRWITTKQQARNMRTNVYITYNGETHCLSEWAEIIGIKAGTLNYRIRHGWSVEEALTTPIMNTYKRSH